MPKYLDLIYRVKDSASEALKRAKKAQDETGKSAGSLRQQLKGLKAGWTELKSAIGLAQQALQLLNKVFIESAREANAWAIEQYEAAKASGNLTQEIEDQYRIALLYGQLEKERLSTLKQWGLAISKFTAEARIQTQMQGASTQQIKDEIARRLELVDAIRTQSREVQHLSENQLIARAAAAMMEGRNAQASWYLDQAAAIRIANSELSKYITLAQNALNLKMSGRLSGGFTDSPAPSGWGDGSKPSSGAPRLQGNTQADRDRYNQQYRVWVNSLGGDG